MNFSGCIGQRMRVSHLLLAALCAAFLAAPAHAQTGPVIAIPGKAGVPVIINGVIADGAVIWGDWGLARPGHGEDTSRRPWATARSMLSRRLAQPSIRADCLPSAAPAANSAQDRAAITR